MRLGHVSYSKLNKMMKKSMLKGLPQLDVRTDMICATSRDFVFDESSSWWSSKKKKRGHQTQKKSRIRYNKKLENILYKSN